MEPEEYEDREICALCGAIDTERGFAFGVGNVLCSGCAAARGGRYDAMRDLWEVAPDVAGLPDEAYGAAPHERQRGRP